jgi:hypothetical protein
MAVAPLRRIQIHREIPRDPVRAAHLWAMGNPLSIRLNEKADQSVGGNEKQKQSGEDKHRDDQLGVHEYVNDSSSDATSRRASQSECGCILGCDNFFA